MELRHAEDRMPSTNWNSDMILGLFKIIHYIGRCIGLCGLVNAAPYLLFQSEFIYYDE